VDIGAGLALTLGLLLLEDGFNSWNAARFWHYQNDHEVGYAIAHIVGYVSTRWVGISVRVNASNFEGI